MRAAYGETVNFALSTPAPPRLMLPDYRQEGLSISVEFAGTDAGDRPEFRQGGGPNRCHFAQHRIMEDHVRRDLRFRRQIAAQGSEGLEQRVADGVRCIGATPPPLCGRGRLNDLDTGLSFQARAGVAAQLQTAVLVGDQAAPRL